MKLRYTYVGTPVPWWCPVAFLDGWEDAGAFDRFEPLYRAPWHRRALYAAGFWVGRALGRKPPQGPRGTADATVGVAFGQGPVAT